MNRVLVKQRRKTGARGISRLFFSLSLVAFGVLSASAQANEAPLVNADPNAPELAMATVNTTGEQIAYDVVDGMAMLEGDIVLGTHKEVQEFGIDPLDFVPEEMADCPVDPDIACSTINTSRTWPNGIVPFTLAEGTTTLGRDSVLGAIAEWETKTSVRFIQRTNETAYIEFLGTGNGSTCSSSLGRTGGRQFIRYAGSGRGCMVHEIGHAMGLNHEQNRNDRDDFVNIDFTNVAGNFQSQFRKATTSTDVGPYDFGSVMHYGAFTFALDRSRPVLTAIDPSITTRDIGGVSLLSPIDVQGIEFVYGRSPTPTPTPTLGGVTASATDNPDDVRFAIDGDPSTRWTTKRPQTPNMAFQVDLGRAQTVGSVRLDTAQSPNDSPENYVLSTSTNGTDFTVAASGNGTERVTEINFSPRSARFVRIIQTGSKDRFWFSIHELTVAASSIGTPANSGGPTRPGDWVRCSAENQTCNFAGAREVGYGAGDTWAYGTFNNGIDCNNATFGDPTRGTFKACFIRQ